MPTNKQEQDLIKAFGSMPQDIMTGAVPPFVQQLMGQGAPGRPGNIDPKLIELAELAKQGKLPDMPGPKGPDPEYLQAMKAGAPPPVAAMMASESANRKINSDLEGMVRVEQSSRKNRAKQAARAFMEAFPEAIFTRE
jgi:hypothetical protein